MLRQKISFLWKLAPKKVLFIDQSGSRAKLGLKSRSLNVHGKNLSKTEIF